MRIMRRSFVALTLVLLALSPAWAGNYTGEERFSLDDLTFGRKSGFDLIELEDGSFTLTTGSPALPCRTVDVALPDGASVTGVALLDVVYTDVEGRFELIPSARPRKITNPAQGNPFVKDESIYGVDADFPGKSVEIVREWDMVGQQFVTLRLFPVQYNPVSGRVRLATSISFEVQYDVDPNFARRTYNFSDTVRAKLERRLKSRAVNSEAVTIPAWNGMGSRSLPAGDFEYVIITTTSYENEWGALIDHHTRLGIPATVVTTDYIYVNYSGNDNPARIRNFVIDAHATWGTIYILIGGDTSKVPCGWAYYQGDNIPTDQYLADIDDDWKCELHVGRAPVDSTGEIATFVGKTVDYMASPPSGFGDEAFFMGFDLDSSSPSEDLMEIIIDHWMPAWTDISKEYDSESGGHENDVDAYVNAGQSLINHSDHCGTTSVGVGSRNHGSHLSISECQAFNNGAKQSVFYSLGCYCGNYESSDCWVEEFVENDNGGGVGGIGNSRYGWYWPGGSWHTYSSLFDRKFFKTLWMPEYESWRSGETNGVSKDNIDISGYYEMYIFMELNLMGDPALPIWTDVPASPALEFCPLIGLGQQGFTVNVKAGGSPAEGALVCLNVDGDVYERGETNSQGNVVLFIDPTVTGTMDVTVSGDNILPATGTCAVDSGGTDLTMGLSLDKTGYLIGETIHCDLTVTNNTANTQNTTVWVNLTLPGGDTYPETGSLSTGPWTLSFAPNETKNGTLYQKLPWYAPVGTYMFHAYVGPEPGIVSEAHETFTVSP